MFFDGLVTNFHQCWDSAWIWCNIIGAMGLDCLFLYFLDSLLTRIPFAWVLCAENLRLNENYLVMHYVSAAFTAP